VPHYVDVPDHEREIEEWRAFRRERVAGPEGWLAVVGLWWLQEGPNLIGSDGENLIALPTGPPRLGSVLVHGGTATFEFDRGIAARAPFRLEDDGEGHPTVVRFGSLTLTVIRREGKLGLRVKDAANPARGAFRGLRYFPVDARWRVEARLEPADQGRTVALPTVLDTIETYAVAGTLAFDLAGRRRTLEAYLEPGETDLFVMFGDATNGDETFGGGRYLYATLPDDLGRVAVDFNRAYNPPCVFTPHSTCALAPPANLLPVRVEAGELRYEDEAATEH
jgi:uncharacterized protein (DUF1684 family)